MKKLYGSTDGGPGRVDVPHKIGQEIVVNGTRDPDTNTLVVSSVVVP